MTNEAGIPRSLLILAVCVPLALFLGYAMAAPATLQNVAVVGLIFMVITFPLWLRWHHALLILSWNSILVAFFLPGQQPLWVAVASVSLFFSMVNRTLTKQGNFISVPVVARPLICLVLIIAFTAFITGGIGGGVLGSAAWGGKRYFTTFGAVVGYFALTAVRIPSHRAMLMTSLFFLSTTVSVISDLIYQLGPRFYFLYLLFNPELASQQAMTRDTLNRMTGLSWSANAFLYYLVLRWGVRGLFDFGKPFRLFLFLALVPLSLLGGFRSIIIMLILFLFIQFWLEGLFRTPLFPALIMAGVMAVSLLVAFANQLPLSMQRSISFLPVKVDPMAQIDAAGTTAWRLLMWKAVLPEVPRYFFVGKGFSYSGADFYLTQQAVIEGKLEAYEPTLICGNYHNGWLTILIPFGIFGLMCFFWFCWAGLKVLYANFRFGEESQRSINTFLLAYFLCRLFFYLTVYGQFDLDLPILTGLVGLSISLNGGIRKPASLPNLKVIEKKSALVSVNGLEPAVVK